MNIPIKEITSLMPAMRAIIENAASRNTFYRRSELKFALLDRTGLFHGCFASLAALEGYVERCDDSEGWINKPTAIVL